VRTRTRCATGLFLILLGSGCSGSPTALPPPPPPVTAPPVTAPPVTVARALEIAMGQMVTATITGADERCLEEEGSPCQRYRIVVPQRGALTVRMDWDGPNFLGFDLTNHNSDGTQGAGARATGRVGSGGPAVARIRVDIGSTIDAVVWFGGDVPFTSLYQQTYQLASSLEPEG
jgi:hypothetical protein